MAYKRKLVVEQKEPQAERSHQELGWKDWLLRCYASSWYLVGALFLDMIIFIEAQRTLRLDMLGAGALTATVIAIELYTFIKIWGRNGPLGNHQANQ
jgi:hypothetical protein